MNKRFVGGMVLAAMAAVGAAQAQEAPYCREYQQKVTIGGKVRETYGTACLQPDGSWQKQDVPTDQDVMSDVVSQDLQVASYDPPVYTQVIYEPAYTPVYYGQPYYSGVGLSFGWSDHEHRRGGTWHGGHRRGGHGHWRH